MSKPLKIRISNEKQAAKVRRGLVRLRQEIKMWESFGYTAEQNHLEHTIEAECTAALEAYEARS